MRDWGWSRWRDKIHDPIGGSWDKIRDPIRGPEPAAGQGREEGSNQTLHAQGKRTSCSVVSRCHRHNSTAVYKQQQCNGGSGRRSNQALKCTLFLGVCTCTVWQYTQARVITPYSGPCSVCSIFPLSVPYVLVNAARWPCSDTPGWSRTRSRSRQFTSWAANVAWWGRRGSLKFHSVCRCLREWCWSTWWPPWTHV